MIDAVWCSSFQDEIWDNDSAVEDKSVDDGNDGIVPLYIAFALVPTEL